MKLTVLLLFHYFAPFLFILPAPWVEGAVNSSVLYVYCRPGVLAISLELKLLWSTLEELMDFTDCVSGNCVLCVLCLEYIFFEYVKQFLRYFENQILDVMPRFQLLYFLVNMI